MRYWLLRSLSKIPSELELTLNDVSARFHVRSMEEYNSLQAVESGIPSGERMVIEDILDTVRPDDIIWDIGSHIGIFSCLIAEKVNTGYVVAFEPHPVNYERLKENIELNNQTKVLLEQVAVSDMEGEISLATAGGVSELYSTKNIQKNSISVPTESEKSILENYDKPDIIKIDVEGAELDVLKGLESTLSDRKCRCVWVETHEAMGVSISSINDKLESYGFETEQPYEERPDILVARK